MLCFSLLAVHSTEIQCSVHFEGIFETDTLLKHLGRSNESSFRAKKEGMA